MPHLFDLSRAPLDVANRRRLSAYLDACDWWGWPVDLRALLLTGMPSNEVAVVLGTDTHTVVQRAARRRMAFRSDRLKRAPKIGAPVTAPDGPTPWHLADCDLADTADLVLLGGYVDACHHLGLPIEVEAMVLTGRTAKEAAAIAGRSVQALEQSARIRGLRFTGVRQRTRIPRDILLRIADRPIRVQARLLGVSEGKVSYWRRQHGLTQATSGDDFEMDRAA